MLNKLRRTRADLATMNVLFPAAERIAREDGIEHPGAEHLLLAAFDLDDGIAHDALGGFDVDPAEFRAAILVQHDEALRSIGVIADDNAITAALPPSAPPGGPYRSQGSLQTAFQHAVELAKRDKAALNSGYILVAVTDAEYGTIAGGLRHLGIDATVLHDRTRSLLDHARSSQDSDR